MIKSTPSDDSFRLPCVRETHRVRIKVLATKITQDDVKHLFRVFILIP